MEYLEVTKDIYKQAAITPDVGLPTSGVMAACL